MPSWKIHTRAPKLADTESRVMITALMGIAIDPKSRKRITIVASIVQPTANGSRCASPARKSAASAALPPTAVVTPSPGDIARTTGIMSVAARLDGL